MTKPQNEEQKQIYEGDVNKSKDRTANMYETCEITKMKTNRNRQRTNYAGVAGDSYNKSQRHRNTNIYETCEHLGTT